MAWLVFLGYFFIDNIFEGLPIRAGLCAIPTNGGEKQVEGRADQTEGLGFFKKRNELLPTGGEQGRR